MVPNSYRLEWFPTFGYVFGYISQEEKPHQANTHLKSSPSHGFPRPRYENAPRKILKQEVINGICMFFCLQWSLYIMYRLNINTNSVYVHIFVQIWCSNECACRSLSIYPDGNTKEGGQGHVSIDLVLMDSSSLPLDWEINAIVNFSAYNFIDDEYHITQGTVSYSN